MTNQLDGYCCDGLRNSNVVFLKSNDFPQHLVLMNNVIEERITHCPYCGNQWSAD